MSLRVLCPLAVAALGIGSLASAQTAPAKSQAKPPSIVIPKASPTPPPPKSLSGKPASGKLLTRDELRSCMKRLDEVNTGAKDVEQKRAAMDREKDELVKRGDALKAERADVEAKLAAVRGWEDRMRTHGAEVETFNQRMKALEAMSRNEREAQVPALEAERTRLTKAREALAAEEARLVPPYQAAVKAYNEKADARDGEVGSWNDRNKALNEVALKAEDERSAWVVECANRPYREDDEIAIKQGK